MTFKEENTLQSLLPLERAELFQKHLIRDNLTKSEIAKKYNKSLAYVSNTMRLLKLPDIIQDGLSSGDISEGHARALLTASSKAEMIIIYRKIILENISVRETERLARESKQQ